MRILTNHLLSVHLFFFTRELQGVMAAKEVASSVALALHLLTSDEIHSAKDWVDNDIFQALVSEYFTGSCDETSDESDNGM